jgi:protein-S-isoprenylcysteine O-methyltransferase Ste14
MGTVARTLTYGSLFVAFWLVFMPRWVAGVGPDAPMPPYTAAQVVGIALVAAGAVIALWCALAFALVGKGTPAPFDPPRRLVVVGPYRHVRNPMYVGAGIAVLGSALVYESWIVVAYLAVLTIGVQLFVTLYEEPTLRRLFGAEYEAYARSVHRWRPRITPYTPETRHA